MITGPTKTVEVTVRLRVPEEVDADTISGAVHNLIAVSQVSGFYPLNETEIVKPYQDVIVYGKLS